MFVVHCKRVRIRVHEILNQLELVLGLLTRNVFTIVAISGLCQIHSYPGTSRWKT